MRSINWFFLLSTCVHLATTLCFTFFTPHGLLRFPWKHINVLHIVMIIEYKLPKVQIGFFISVLLGVHVHLVVLVHVAAASLGNVLRLLEVELLL